MLSPLPIRHIAASLSTPAAQDASSPANNLQPRVARARTLLRRVPVSIDKTVDGEKN